MSEDPGHGDGHSPCPSPQEIGPCLADYAHETSQSSNGVERPDVPLLSARPGEPVTSVQHHMGYQYQQGQAGRSEADIWALNPVT